MWYSSSNLGLFVIRPHVNEASRCAILGMLAYFNLTVEKVISMASDSTATERVEKEYEEHRGKPFFDDLVESMTPGTRSIVVVVVSCPSNPEHEYTWKRVMDAAGCTDPRDAAAGTIRRTFGEKSGVLRYNAVHRPDSWEATRRSAKIWLDEDWDFEPEQDFY